MAPLIIVGALLGILVPVLLASAVADLTKRKVIGLIVLVAVGGSAVWVWESDPFQRQYWRWRLPQMPTDEANFVADAERMRDLRVAQSRSTGPQSALQEVESRLCAISPTAHDWVGRVARMYPSSSGDEASLAIRVSPKVILRTALFAGPTATLIPAGSPLFETVKNLTEDQVVHFSGSFVDRLGACPGETPPNQNEKQRDPEFLFRFTRVVSDAGT